MLDGAAPQSAAVAALIFAACLVIIAKDRMQRFNAPSSSHMAMRTEPFHTPASVTGPVGKEGDGDPYEEMHDVSFPVNIVKACEVAMSSLSMMRKCYAQLRLNAQHVLPPAVKKAFLQSGRVGDWTALLPTVETVEQRSRASVVAFGRRRMEAAREARMGHAHGHGRGHATAEKEFYKKRSYISHESGLEKAVEVAEARKRPRTILGSKFRGPLTGGEKKKAGNGSVSG